MPHPARTISIAIDRSPDDVYAFASNPENLPRWSFIDSIVSTASETWVAQTPDGSVTIRFAKPNRLGVLDHVVRAAPDLEVHVPMRVIANGAGSEVLFTLFRLDGMTDEAFERDTQTVQRDLAKLKQLLESERR